MVHNIKQTALPVEPIKTVRNTIHAAISILVGAETQTHIASVVQMCVPISVSIRAVCLVVFNRNPDFATKIQNDFALFQSGLNKQILFF